MKNRRQKKKILTAIVQIFRFSFQTCTDNQQWNNVTFPIFNSLSFYDAENHSIFCLFI